MAREKNRGILGNLTLDLLDGYQKLARPVRNHSVPTLVAIDVNIHQIEKLVSQGRIQQFQRQGQGNI